MPPVAGLPFSAYPPTPGFAAVYLCALFFPTLPAHALPAQAAPLPSLPHRDDPNSIHARREIMPKILPNALYNIGKLASAALASRRVASRRRSFFAFSFSRAAARRLFIFARCCTAHAPRQSTKGCWLSTCSCRPWNLPTLQRAPRHEMRPNLPPSRPGVPTLRRGAASIFFLPFSSLFSLISHCSAATSPRSPSARRPSPLLHFAHRQHSPHSLRQDRQGMGARVRAG